MKRLVFLFAVALAACGGSDGTGMADRLGDVGKHLSALRDDTAAHAVRIEATDALAAIPPEEATHRHDAGEHLGAMDGDMEHMEMCGDMMGNSPDMSGMWDLMADFREECDYHDAAMGSAGDMGTAHDEERRHQDAMGEMFDAMEEMRDDMMGHSGEYDCGSGMGM